MFDHDFEILNIPSNFYWLTKEKQSWVEDWNLKCNFTIAIRWWIKTMAICKRHILYKCWWLFRLLLLLGFATWLWPGLAVMKVRLEGHVFLDDQVNKWKLSVTINSLKQYPPRINIKNFLYRHPNICWYISLDKLIPLLCWLVLPCDCDNHTSTRQSTMSSPYLQFVF